MGYELSWTQKGVFRRFFGNVTSDELLRSVVEVEGDYRFDDLRYAILDFRECTGYSISSEMMESIAAIDGAAAMVNPKIRIAVIATSSEMIALAQEYIDSPFNAYPTRIFATLDEAKVWLGLQ